MTKLDFSGLYQKTKSCFWGKNGISLIVGKRSTPQVNTTKTRDFLLFKETATTIDKPKYLSSLYPTQDDTIYEIEYCGDWYSVSFNGNGSIHIESIAK